MKHQSPGFPYACYIKSLVIVQTVFYFVNYIFYIYM
jgi:hypothetical protein